MTSAMSLRRRNTGSSSITTTTTASSNVDGKDHADTASSSPYPSQSVDRQDSLMSTKDYDDTLHTNPGKAPDEEIDGSQMRVEEKIARAYHRGIAWRKVLVKVEPDAHNNIIVRRMFANAFGWPVVKHMVDAHFSDAARARTRVDDEVAEELALDMNQPPDQFGGEIKQTEGDKGATSEAHQESVAQRTARKEQEEEEGDQNAKKPEVVRSESLAREAEDKVTDLPNVDCSPPRTGSSGGGTADAGHEAGNSPTRARHPPKQQVFRQDSMTWSDGDWFDTDDDEHSDSGGKSPRPPPSPSHSGFDTALLSPTSGRKSPQPSSQQGGSKDSSPRLGSSSGSWNWTEKIVGRSSSKRSASGPGASADNAEETPVSPDTPTVKIDPAKTDGLGVD